MAAIHQPWLNQGYCSWMMNDIMRMRLILTTHNNIMNFHDNKIINELVKVSSVRAFEWREYCRADDLMFRLRRDTE